VPAAMNPIDWCFFSDCFGPHEPCLAPLWVGQWPYFGNLLIW
jgi:hypothetical protein